MTPTTMYPEDARLLVGLDDYLESTGRDRWVTTSPHLWVVLVERGYVLHGESARVRKGESIIAITPAGRAEVRRLLDLGDALVEGLIDALDGVACP